MHEPQSGLASSSSRARTRPRRSVQRSLESWRRSAWSEVAAASLVELPFNENIDRSGRLARAAQPVMDELATLVTGDDICVLLSNARAYSIDRRVSPGALRRRLDANGGLPGTCWREDIAGTNATGTVLRRERRCA